MKHSRSQSGFSLIELLIVVSIALIIAGFAVPQFLSAIRNSRINGDARSINGELLLAKMRAASNFTWARVRFDITNGTFVSELWDKTANSWAQVSVGGPQYLSSGVAYGFGSQSTDPNGNSPVQAPACRAGASGDPSGGSNLTGSTACIMFNSRGYPVDNSHATTSTDAIYITDGNMVQGVTVSFSGMTATWLADSATTWIRH